MTMKSPTAHNTPRSDPPVMETTAPAAKSHHPLVQPLVDAMNATGLLKVLAQGESCLLSSPGQFWRYPCGPRIHFRATPEVAECFARYLLWAQKDPSHRTHRHWSTQGSFLITGTPLDKLELIFELYNRRYDWDLQHSFIWTRFLTRRHINHDLAVLASIVQNMPMNQLWQENGPPHQQSGEATDSIDHLQ